VVALIFATGLLIGFVEEVLTRGIAVKMLRDAGHSEWVVAAVSSLLFAVMHSINLFAGAAPLVVAVTVFYAFGFGVCMYLSMRVSGFLLVAIVLHGLTDPTTILATGGLDDGLFRGCGRVTRPNRDDTGSRAKLLPESLVPHNRKIVEISIIKIGSH